MQDTDKRKLKNIIHTIIEQCDREKIDDHINEFVDFDVKEAKSQLKMMTEKLLILRKDVGRDLYRKTSHNVSRYNKLKQECRELDAKIQRYSENVPEINSLIQGHKQYVLRKHGKVV